MKRGHPGILLLVAIVGALALIWWRTSRWVQDQLVSERRLQVSEEAAPRGTALSLALNRRIIRLQSLYAFAQTEPSLTDFNTFAAETYAGSRGIRYLLAAPRGIIRVVYPPAARADLLSYDLRTHVSSDEQVDIDRSIDLRVITLSPPRTDDPDTLNAWLAVYHAGEYWGLVAISLDLQTLLADANLTPESGGVSYALRDDSGEVFFGSADVFSRDPVTFRVDLPEGEWTLAAAPTSSWAQDVSSSLTAYHAASMLIIALVGGLAHLIITRQAALSEAVTERTAEITALNRDLENRVASRTAELSTLLQMTRVVVSTLELHPVLEHVLEQLRKAIDYRTAAIYGYTPPNTLTLLEVSGPDEAEAHPRTITLGTAGTEDIARVIRTREPVIAAAGDDSRGGSDTPTAWLGIPLMVRRRITGMLALEHDTPGAFTDRVTDLALAFTDQAAIAIENARLYTEAQQLAALRERQKLARELHDSVSQVLYGIVLGVKTAQMQISSAGGGPIQETLSYILSLAEGGVYEMRALIFELRPESLETEGLAAALNRQAEMLRTRYDIAVDASCNDEPVIPIAAKETLYRVAREAIQNIIRHADAAHVTISLAADDEIVTLEIADDGAGFDPAGEFPGHLGLQSMRERVEEKGGDITIASTPGEGTRIIVRLPVED